MNYWMKNNLFEDTFQHFSQLEDSLKIKKIKEGISKESEFFIKKIFIFLLNELNKTNNENLLLLQKSEKDIKYFCEFVLLKFLKNIYSNENFLQMKFVLIEYLIIIRNGFLNEKYLKKLNKKEFYFSEYLTKINHIKQNKNLRNLYSYEKGIQFNWNFEYNKKGNFISSEIRIKMEI